MLGKAQDQTAGANSQQIQVSGDLVIVDGVTEERAAEIAHQAALDVLSQYSSESAVTAMDRVSRFDIAMVERLKNAGLLGALGDPAMQVTMRKAQIGAASTERSDDYELLASLIEDRARRGNDRPVRAGINRAVEVVDQLDEVALSGLTLIQAALQYRPMAGAIDTGLNVMEQLLAELVNEIELPSGREWIEHLDVLGAVRIDTVQKFLSFDDFWPTKTPGYVTVGVEDGSDALTQATNALEELGLTLISSVPHELKPGYVRLPFPFSGSLRAALETIGYADPKLTEIVNIALDRFMVDTPDRALNPTYMERVRQHPAHRRLSDWWATLPTHFVVTPVGRVLARANAQRLDRVGLLPPLD